MPVCPSVVVLLMFAMSDFRIYVSVAPESMAVMAVLLVSVVTKLICLLHTGVGSSVLHVATTPRSYFLPSYPSILHGAVASFIAVV